MWYSEEKVFIIEFIIFPEISFVVILPSHHLRDAHLHCGGSAPITSSIVHSHHRLLWLSWSVMHQIISCRQKHFIAVLDQFLSIM